METIAIIDDDVDIGDALSEILKAEGYGVLRAYSETEALYLLSENKPDLVLLDLMLPGLSGEEVLGRIRDIPVIVLSAKADVEDKVGMLLGGAVDYMTKPFNPKELLARIIVQMRRKGDFTLGETLRVGGLSLNTVSMEARMGKSPIRLTRTEYAILKLLMAHPNQVISKRALLEHIGSDTPDCTERSLKQHVSNLRKKLQNSGGAARIETVWGIGFKISDENS